ncbi:hypothetical protein DQ04_01821040 [Trypanosoma grayi]|uniref:hypothetical protein n=1 Tax=Trypanosoma grayi TaxID=71804 RepID=UPI0004F4112D|nr:hypothetical protein DQ04_01821040 [Trypanosoma grayi]KEG12299.1 hypothetical protein DQ04_01821040 [Trypanosoma grayi]
MTAARRAATAATTGLLFGGASAAAGGCCCWWWWKKNPAGEGASSSGRFASVAAPIPTDLQGRFRHYARRDADGREVLDPTGLVACVCLLDDDERRLLAGDAENRLPPHVRQRLAHLFALMDVNCNNLVTYDEFCIFLTLLSTRRKYMQLAFGVFDKKEDNRLSKHSFRHLLNALMIDPHVKVVKKRPRRRELLPPVEASLGSSAAVAATADVTEQVDADTQPTGIPTMTKDELLTSPLAKRLFGPRGENHVSFDEFWSLLREIRREVRAVEFGLYDPRNTGQITMSELQKIVLRRGRGDGTDSSSSIVSSGGCNAEDEELASWDFYLKVFDVIFEYETVEHGMNLAIRSKTPPSAADLSVKPQAEALAALPLSKTGDEWELDSAEFHQVLKSSQALSHLTREDVDRLVRVFDRDGSGKLSPSEFARMCQWRTSFFTPQQPRFNLPRRNAVQQFVYCMQQLE